MLASLTPHTGNETTALRVVHTLKPVVLEALDSSGDECKSGGAVEAIMLDVHTVRPVCCGLNMYCDMLQRETSVTCMLFMHRRLLNSWRRLLGSTTLCSLLVFTRCEPVVWCWPRRSPPHSFLSWEVRIPATLCAYRPHCPSRIPFGFVCV